MRDYMKDLLLMCDGGKVWSFWVCLIHLRNYQSYHIHMPIASFHWREKEYCYFCVFLNVIFELVAVYSNVKMQSSYAKCVKSTCVPFYYLKLFTFSMFITPHHYPPALSCLSLTALVSYWCVWHA